MLLPCPGARSPVAAELGARRERMMMMITVTSCITITVRLTIILTITITSCITITIRLTIIVTITITSRTYIYIYIYIYICTYSHIV